MKKLLVAGTNDVLMENVQAALERKRYVVTRASSTRETLAQIYAQRPDLIIMEKGATNTELDIGEVCRLIREISDIPLIVIVGEKKNADKLRSLELGADDCLVQPFSVAELAARAEALLRRATPQQLKGRLSVYWGRDVMVDFRSREVFIRGRRVRLSNTEYRLLAKLIQNASRTISLAQLLECIGGDESKASRLRLRRCIRRLREKVEQDPSLPDLITTQRGEGYRFEGATVPDSLRHGTWLL